MNKYGKLFIVATPIGNFEDISLRAIKTLENVDQIVCEDTKISKKLLNHLGISKKLCSYNNFNENAKTDNIIQSLLNGDNIALISDAGTPLISDPGYLLVKQAYVNDIEVTSIPGCSSIITALTLSSIPCNKFAFLGFLDKSSSKKQAMFKQYAIGSLTLVFFESPRRIIATLKDIASVFGNEIEVCLCRELTKTHENVLIDSVDNLLKHYNNVKPLGEFVVIFQPANYNNFTQDDVISYIKNNLNTMASKKLAKEMANMFNSTPTVMYDQIISYKNSL